MGVYGGNWPLPVASLCEKILSSKFLNELRENFFRRRKIVSKSGTGVMGCTNAIIKRDLWERHNFDEAYGLGGEDEEWARYWSKKGYKAVRDAKFSVLHSHGLGFFDFLRQMKYWRSLSKPQSFDRSKLPHRS